MFNEKQFGLYIDWDWQGAKSDKFPTKSDWKWMRHNFLWQKILCLQKCSEIILGTLGTGHFENKMLMWMYYLIEC